MKPAATTTLPEYGKVPARMTSSRVVRVLPDVVFRSINDEALFVTLSSQQYYFLDLVGSRMCELLIEHGEVDRAIEKLLSEYDVDEETLRRDIEVLIGNLSANGLITVEQEPDAE